VYWIGGAPGAGKSTLARRLADQHGWYLYHTDDVMTEHAGRAAAADAPLLAQFMAMDHDEGWSNPPGPVVKRLQEVPGVAVTEPVHTAPGLLLGRTVSDRLIHLCRLWHLPAIEP
jgi:hypothetical protein